MSRAFDKLVKQVEKTADPFAEGDVIRFKAAGTYTYAALKAGGRWWITGTSSFYRHDGVTYEELVEYLGRSDVTHIDAATNWTEKAKIQTPAPAHTRKTAACPKRTIQLHELDYELEPFGYDPSEPG